jgi:integrase
MATRPRGHVRDLKNGRWRLYAEAAPDPITGVRRQATQVVTVANRRAALDELARHVTDVAAGRWDRGTRTRTVGQALDAWLEHTAAEPNTIHEWRGSLNRYIRPHIGNLPITKLDTQRLDVLYRQLVRDGGKDGAPLSASTVRKAHTPLRLALAQAVRWRWITRNPAAEASLPAMQRKSIEPPAAEDVARLVELADQLDPEWSTAVRLLAHTGMRRGELCGLRWSDVDLEIGELAVHRVVVRAGSETLVRDYGKTASSNRTVGLGASMVDRLTAIRKLQRERALSAGVRPRDGFVFSTDVAQRTPWQPGVITKRFMRLRKRADLPTVRLHDLRHYMATRWIADGVDVVTVAGRGGWTNANMLLKTYAHWVPARDREAAKRLDDVG